MRKICNSWWFRTSLAILYHSKHAIKHPDRHRCQGPVRMQTQNTSSSREYQIWQLPLRLPSLHKFDSLCGSQGHHGGKARWVSWTLALCFVPSYFCMCTGTCTIATEKHCLLYKVANVRDRQANCRQPGYSVPGSFPILSPDMCRLDQRGKDSWTVLVEGFFAASHLYSAVLIGNSSRCW